MEDRKDEKVRIQKALSDAGALSRRHAEEAVAAGRITVNGRPCKIGQKVDPSRDIITLDGERIQARAHSKKVYLMLNKPRGVVTTLSDEMGRKCVADLVKDAPAKVYPVGRLDRNSEGLLLMTNDGDFANRVMHPSYQITKTYRVTVRGNIREEQLARLTEGVSLEDGFFRPEGVAVLSEEPERTVLRLVLNEGRKREIRRMIEAVGLTVTRLKRTAEGSVKLGMLPPGKWRELTSAEVAALSGRKPSRRG